MMTSYSRLTQILICLLLVGCAKDEIKVNIAGCHQGQVILEDGCSGQSLISLDSDFHIGKKLKVNDLEYLNVIKVPGLIHDDSIYFTMREFNNEKDGVLFTPIFLCLINTDYDVPLYVITNYSASHCH